MADLLDKNRQTAELYQSDRRGFLTLGLAATAALGFWTPALAAAPRTGRTMQFFNHHTSEKFTGEYWYDGRYLPDAFRAIKSVLRDHRTNETYPIDPRLIDILYVLQKRTGNANPFGVFSGYRSPATNAYLRRNGEGVAKSSLHMQGQAIDINQKGTRLSNLRATALDLKSGGVGFYPSSDFVHIDTGRARAW